MNYGKLQLASIWKGGGGGYLTNSSPSLCASFFVCRVKNKFELKESDEKRTTHNTKKVPGGEKLRSAPAGSRTPTPPNPTVTRVYHHSKMCKHPFETKERPTKNAQLKKKEFDKRMNAPGGVEPQPLETAKGTVGPFRRPDKSSLRNVCGGHVLSIPIRELSLWCLYAVLEGLSGKSKRSRQADSRPILGPDSVADSVAENRSRIGKFPESARIGVPALEEELKNRRFSRRFMRTPILTAETYTRINARIKRESKPNRARLALFAEMIGKINFRDPEIAHPGGSVVVTATHTCTRSCSVDPSRLQLASCQLPAWSSKPILTLADPGCIKLLLLAIDQDECDEETQISQLGRRFLSETTRRLIISTAKPAACSPPVTPTDLGFDFYDHKWKLGFDSPSSTQTLLTSQFGSPGAPARRELPNWDVRRVCVRDYFRGEFGLNSPS
ncbi:hypothetical protein B0H11DRAFT_1898627 [Mycena galericulata]|nr:hypothetical protein B0H11DRAFT_1898627 [Mycena galericulata]